MFGLGPIEFIVILIIALIVFGPKKLPEVGRTLGRLLGEVKKYSQQFEDQIQQELFLTNSENKNKIKNESETKKSDEDKKLKGSSDER